MISTFDVITGTRDDDRIDGTRHGDVISGLGGDDVLQGLGGADSLVGGGGDDTLLGGSGNDTLDGGNGHDVLQGGSGDDMIILGSLSADTVTGGSGFDTVSFATVDHGLFIDLVGGQASTRITDVEGVIGTNFDDVILGPRAASLLIGGAGDDLINPQHSAATLDGGDGDDQLSGTRGGSDYLFGGDGDDALGIGQLDVADGGAGEDFLRLAAGRGATLSGGAGPDHFQFAGAVGKAAVPDLITDLTSDDQIDISGIDANRHVSGDQAFTLVAALDGHAGEAALVYDPGIDETALLLDTTGDGLADITIRLSGDQTGFSNFVL